MWNYTGKTNISNTNQKHTIMQQQTKRDELVVGVEYYFSSWQTTKGIFAGRQNGYIYFTPTVKGSYSTIADSIDKDDPEYSVEWKDCVYFIDDNEWDGFIEVEIK